MYLYQIIRKGFFSLPQHNVLNKPNGRERKLHSRLEIIDVLKNSKTNTIYSHNRLLLYSCRLQHSVFLCHVCLFKDFQVLYITQTYLLPETKQNIRLCPMTVWRLSSRNVSQNTTTSKCQNLVQCSVCRLFTFVREFPTLST